MKIAIFCSQKPIPSSIAKIFRDKGYTLVISQNPDEVDQIGKQCNGTILICDDARWAYRFFVENKWTGFPMLRILFLPKKPIINADVSTKLAQVELQIAVLGEDAALAEKISRFEKKDDGTIDIEFSVHDDLEKKA